MDAILPARSTLLKSPVIRLAILVALLLVAMVRARAQALYVHKELFSLQDGAAKVVGFNNLGEVLYGATTKTGFVNGLWLPKPNYGLPAGFNTLTNITGGVVGPLGDDGWFYSAHLTPVSGENLMYRASPAGESGLLSQVPVIEPLPNAPDGTARQRRFNVLGTTSGDLFGDVRILGETPAEAVDDAPSLGFFRGTPPDVQYIQAPLPGSCPGPPGDSVMVAASPNGTILGESYCSNGWDWVLSVIDRHGTRIITDSLNSQPSDPQRYGGGYYDVNDSGDAAGQDSLGLWLSPHTGGTYRAGLTNINLNVRVDPDGSVWFVSRFYQDIWNWSPAGIHQLNLPWSSWGYTDFPTLWFVNNRGELIVEASKGPNEQVWVLLPPALRVNLSLSTNRVSLGDQFTVTATITTPLSDQPLTGVSPTAQLVWQGSANFQIGSGPVPSPPLSLTPGGQTNFQWTCKATRYGTASFGLAVQAMEGSNLVVSLPATSPEVNVSASGDLLIKTDSAGNAGYAGAGIFQTIPISPQIATNVVGTNETSTFEVKVVNSDTVPQNYILTAKPDSNPGWSVQYLSGQADVTAQLSAGMSLPTLAPGESMTLVVNVTPTNAAPTTGESVIFSLGLAGAVELTLDSVEALTVYAPVPVRVTLRRVRSDGFSPESVTAGQTNVNAPLKLVSDPTVLQAQPEIHGGQVADEVTPLLLEVDAPPASLLPYPRGRTFSLNASIVSGGKLAGAQPGELMQILDPVAGAWVSNPTFILSPTNTAAYVWIAPVASDDVQLAPQSQQLQEAIQITDVANGTVAGAQTFAIRKPPIFLIHGYNTPGFWGQDFQNILATTRPMTGINNDPDNFVVTIRYGQDVVPGYAVNLVLPVLQNTAYSLADCAVLASNAFAMAEQVILANWAMTRFDVVAHSQGGLLTRMLCSANPNGKISSPFRNPDNFYRGRFHRVVTIGSPHNGTLLLYYLLSLRQNVGFLRGLGNNPSSPLAGLVAWAGVFSQIVQAKFNPFGPQIQELNDPSPGGNWYPDPTAEFHLVPKQANYRSKLQKGFLYQRTSSNISGWP